jgi:hypothetical protein
MALHDTVIKMIRKNEEKDGGKEAAADKMIKSKAGLVINIFAALLAFTMWFQGSLNSKVMNATIQANDLWVFYQAKSMKQTSYDIAAEEALARGDRKKALEYLAKVDRYEHEPKEGKRALFAEAKQLEADRDHYKLQLPWAGYASTAFQLSIVLLSASILATSMLMFWGSFGLAAVGIVLLSQGIMLWM